MKKIFTLLTMALLAVGASAQTAKDAYLDITQYATLTDESINIKNATTVYSWDDKNKVLVVSAYAVQQSAQKNQDEGVTGYGWMTYTGSNSTGTSWEATGVFNGSAFYGTFSSGSASDRGIVAGKNNNVFSFYVTNCIQVSALVNSKGTSRTITMDIYPVTFDGTTPTRGDKAGTVSDKSGALKTITVDNLDASKIYEIAISGDNTSGSHLYELAFYGKGAAAQEAVDVVFTLSKSEIYVDETAQLLVNDKSWPEDLAFPTSGWDTELISISETGLITPNKAGTATIQFTTAAVEGKYKEGTANLSLTISERPIPDEIDYPTSKNGIKKSGTTAEATVKVLGSNVNAYKFSNGGTDNAITLTIQDGFKVGDIVTISGVISSGDATKSGKVQLLQDIAGSSVWTTENFQDVKDDNTAEPTEGTFVLKSSSEHLYLIRSGNTSVYVTKIKVVRGEAVVSHEATTWDFTKALSEADAENLEADAYWTFDEENNYWVNNSTLTERNVYTALKANDTELDITKGLTFTRDNETGLETGRIRISPTNYFAINGSAVKLNLGILAKDDVVRMRIKGAGDSERSITATNAEVTDGSLTTTDTEVHEVSLKASDDGEVVLTTGNGFQFLAITINDELPEYTPTGISVINAETESAADAPVYNLSGQRVDENYRGVVIKNGRKVVNK